MRKTLATLTLLVAPVAHASSGFLGIFSSASKAALASVGGSVTAAPPATGTTRANAAATRLLEYKRNPQITQQLRDQFIKTIVDAGRKTGKMTPALEQQFRAEFNKVDVVTAYGKALEPKGYKMTNVATGLAVWVITNFEILNDGQAFTDEQNRLVYRQFETAMAASPAVKKMTDADKQKINETLLWIAAFQTNDLEQAAQGAPGYSLESVQTQARELMKQLGIDPDRLQITDKGLTAKGN